MELDGPRRAGFVTTHGTEERRLEGDAASHGERDRERRLGEVCEVEFRRDVAGPSIQPERQPGLRALDLYASLRGSKRGALDADALVENDLADERELLERLGARQMAE